MFTVGTFVRPSWYSMVVVYVYYVHVERETYNFTADDINYNLLAIFYKFFFL